MSSRFCLFLFGFGRPSEQEQYISSLKPKEIVTRKVIRVGDKLVMCCMTISPASTIEVVGFSGLKHERFVRFDIFVQKVLVYFYAFGF